MLDAGYSMLDTRYSITDGLSVFVEYPASSIEDL
jgi:hypothetical protein